MAEFKNPDLESRGGAWISAALLLFVAVIFFSLQWLFVSHAGHGVHTHTQVATPTASVSLNLAERELFAVLALVHDHWVAGWPGSWGWAIVLLTVGINLFILPLRISGLRNSAKMQRIQPEMEAIKARYKEVKFTDPRHNEMAAEIAKLHKDHGVNMAGGCLPLLLQMPLLYGLFGMLRKADVLHGARWLWLHDLSAADPLHILPVLMVCTQLLVQMCTPAPGADQKQQRMIAYAMTFAFGYVSWHYASGVALYAVTGNVVSLATQVAVDHPWLKRGRKRIPLGNG